jgi:hypothetical protein
MRKELHERIDNMPETALNALRLWLNALSADPDDDGLTDDEFALFQECQRDLKEKSESFISLAEYKKRRGIL